VKFLEQCLREAGLSDLQVVLFGSHALGAEADESDLDVAIVSSSFRGKDVFERARLTRDAEMRAMGRFDLPFDIVTLTPEEYEGDSLMASFIKAAASDR
jgi:predicted nucleotidyltransferase